MRIALVNPNWSFAGSIYFGCHEPHLPLEYGYTQALLRGRGHAAEIFDAQAEGLADAALHERVAAFAADMIVVTTAPSYLFWRCPPAELRVPQQTLRTFADLPGIRVAVGPHGSSTPRAALAKLGVDAVVLGECEEVLVSLADTPRDRWGGIAGLCHVAGGEIIVAGGPQAVGMARLPAIVWPPEVLRRHRHHHHRFDIEDLAAHGPGAEIEASRGCPYHCTFCAKDNFRDSYRRRPLAMVMAELDGLLAAGVGYVYFIDEIFLPWRELLEELVRRPVRFGVQTRIDLWSRDMLDLLGAAGCVSIEAGVESLSAAGRDRLAKRCKLPTGALTALLLHAKRSVPFVQANLIATGDDDPQAVQEWRAALRHHGVWANDPVPLFPYPGSPEYVRRWGPPDEAAWERAVEHYLAGNSGFSEIQEAQPRRLAELETLLR